MTVTRQIVPTVVTVALACAGCASRESRFAEIQPPPRTAELAAYDVFVGDWVWQAEVEDAVAPDKSWTGTASWEWTLDKRFLRGSMSSKTERLSFDAMGLWSWHPTKKRYTWWMFSNWGYPQEGSARFDEQRRRWVMPYKSVGLDGTTSYGQYIMTVVSNDRLDWQMTEWADPLRLVKKTQMTGSYQRKLGAAEP